MFGSFGCCDNFRDCHHRERECDHRQKEREVRPQPQQPAVCNVLASISVGTELSLLIIRGHESFRNVIFEGFCNGVALFSALACHNKDHRDNNKDDKNRHNNTFTGILRVCPTDIVAIAI
ncbi:DUF3915 domain-containing protein [Bacillus fungorum]|uniref:DUF3915 domain-containing protein n=1 Tax=Bacillus fungorum TaxID=2039284 RepID=UPI003397724A